MSLVKFFKAAVSHLFINSTIAFTTILRGNNVLKFGFYHNISWILTQIKQMYQKFIVNSTWCLKLAMNKFYFFCYKTIISVMLTLIPQILIPVPYKKGLVCGCFHENLVKFFKIGNFQNASAVLLKLIRLPETKIPNNSFCNDIMRKNCFHFVTVFYGS